MTPKKANRILWVVLVLIIVGSGAALYMADKHLTILAKETAELRAQSQVGQDKIKIYEANKQQFEELNYVEALAKEILPADQDQATIIAEVSQFALRSKLGIAGISFDSVSEGGQDKTKTKTNSKDAPANVQIVPITVELKSGANYDDVLEFLKTLENNRRRTLVTNIDLVPSEDNKSILSQVILKINLYVSQAAEKKD